MYMMMLVVRRCMTNSNITMSKSADNDEREGETEKEEVGEF